MIRAKLTDRANEVRRLEDELEAARRSLRAAILEAKEEGLPLALIARVSGRTRETIYRDLERAEAERS